MNYSTTKTCDTASKRLKTWKIATRNSCNIILAGMLLVAASNAVAALKYTMTAAFFSHPEFAPVEIQNLGDSMVRIHTTGLTGDFNSDGNVDARDFEAASAATGNLPFTQQLELIINLSLGVVEGSSSGQILVDNKTIEFRADVLGRASCLPLNGRACGQLVVDLELQGVLSDPNDPSIVGKMHTEMLGSLVWDDTDLARWSAMTANATIGGNERLINLLLEMMDEGEGIQVTPWTDGQVTN